MQKLSTISCIVIFSLCVSRAFAQEPVKPGSETFKMSSDNITKNEITTSASIENSVAAKPRIVEGWKSYMRGVIIDSLNSRTLPIHDRNRLEKYLYPTSASPNALIKRFKDTTLNDFLFYVGHNFGKDQLKKVNDILILPQTDGVTDYLDGKIKGFYSLMAPTSLKIPSFDHFFHNQPGQLNYETITENQENKLNTIQHFQFNDVGSLLDIPFQIQLSNLSYFDQSILQNTIVKVSFDKKGYNKLLQNKLGKYYDLRKYFLADMDVLSFAKGYFKSEISKTVQNLDKSFLLGRLSLEEMMHLDMQQISEKLLPARQKQLMEGNLFSRQQLLAESANILSSIQKDSIQQLINQEVNYLESVSVVQERIKTVKEKFASSSININQLAGKQNNINSQLENVLNSQGSIEQASKELLPLKGIQRFFLGVKSMNAGSFGMQSSERSISNLLLNGLQLATSKKEKFFNGGLGLAHDEGFTRDLGMNSIFQPSRFMQFFQFGKGDPTKRGSQFSIINANASNIENGRFSSLSLPRNILVGTFTKALQIRKSGLVEAEISKSATQFKNTVSPSSDEILQQKSALLSYTNDFFQTLSVGVRYTDEWKEIGLDHNAHISYAGYGYNNPASPNASKGTFQYDLALRKQVLKRSGSVQLRLANRTYNYDATGKTKWKNFQGNLDAKYRFNRSLNMAVKFNQYQLLRLTDANKQTMYVSRKASLESNMAYSVLNNHARSGISVGWQQFDNVYVQQGSTSDLLMVQSVNSVVLDGGRVLSLNLFYNKELKENQLIGDMLNSDAGISYTLLKKINLTSSLTYLDNKLAARQLGLRQAVNSYIGRKVNLNLYVDWRKNLIEPMNPYLYSNFRGELSLQYLFNN